MEYQQHNVWLAAGTTDALQMFDWLTDYELNTAT